MSDANVRIPEEPRDRLAEVAAGKGLSLRAYLAQLADALLTPAERKQRTEQARIALNEWNGYAPTPVQEALDRRIGEALGR